MGYDDDQGWVLGLTARPAGQNDSDFSRARSASHEVVTWRFITRRSRSRSCASRPSPTCATSKSDPPTNMTWTPSTRAALVVIRAVKPDVVNGRRYKPEEKIAQWCKLSPTSARAARRAAHGGHPRCDHAHPRGCAPGARAGVAVRGGRDAAVLSRPRRGAKRPLSFPTGTFLAGLTIICEAPASSDADRERKRALHSVIMHLSDHGYVASDPSRAAVLWSIALSRQALCTAASPRRRRRKSATMPLP